MGMGNYPCNADTVEESFVKEICPDEFEKLNQTLSDVDYSWDSMGTAYETGDMEGTMNMDLDDEEAELILEVYDVLCNAFKERTGLDLNVNYHNKEDRGSEVDGMFWEVEGVYILSPAGKKYKDKITNVSWTVFG